METGGAVKSTPSEDGRLFAIPMVPYMAPRPKNMLARFPQSIGFIRHRDSEDQRNFIRKIHAGGDKTTLDYLSKELAETDHVGLLFEILDTSCFSKIQKRTLTKMICHPSISTNVYYYSYMLCLERGHCSALCCSKRLLRNCGGVSRHSQ